MKTLRVGMLCGALLGLVVVVTAAQQSETKDKNGAKPAATILQPHPLDSAFSKGDTASELTHSLANNELFQKAVKEALKTRQRQEEANRKNPQQAGPTPAQAARVRFLEVLTGKAAG